MRTAAKVFWLGVFWALLLGSSVMFVFGAGKSARTINLPDGGISAVADDDDGEDEPDVKDRVARISFIRGDVQIRRVGNQDWEKAVLNLPLIEGDEVATSGDARLEIQFNNYVHLRLDQNALLKFTVVKDEGIAVSLSQGTMNLRVTRFEKADGYFEIDAPKTTVAIEESGSYRVDAGKVGDAELHVSVAGGGEARVYSDNAGFTLKNGRGAKVFIDGANAGEWETADAAKLSDEFDAWALDRDTAIAKRLRDAYYDKYYDQDIYGADDLNDYGEWVHTANYGYVWRPYGTSISTYSNWSPYRYGHWRWVGSYGWVWVNDEPWGWATYHHGRWVYYNGGWVWSPYAYYRHTRSWWFPALVVINIVSNNICWYPLSYHHRYYSYNHHNNGWGGNGNHGNGNGGHGNGNAGNGNGGGGAGIKNPPTKWIDPLKNPGNKKRDVLSKLERDEIPDTGVITVDAGDFGTKTKGARTAPATMAKAVLASDPDGEKKGILPEYKTVTGRVSREIAAEKPKNISLVSEAKIGAAVRKTDAPLDQELRNKRMFGGRTPAVKENDQGGGIVPVKDTPKDERRTGAVDRAPRVKTADENPVYRDDATRKKTDDVVKDTKIDQPVRRIPKEDSPKYEQPKEDTTIRVPRNDTPREQPREKPRSDPPPTKRNDPPKEQPKPRNDPPPQKSEPKTETPSKTDGGRKKDGGS